MICERDGVRAGVRACAARASGLEGVHDAHHVLAADGALGHAPAARDARHHVSAVEQHAVDDRVHADLTHVTRVRRHRTTAVSSVCGNNRLATQSLSY